MHQVLNLSIVERCNVKAVCKISDIDHDMNERTVGNSMSMIPYTIFLPSNHTQIDGFDS